MQAPRPLPLPPCRADTVDAFLSVPTPAAVATAANWSGPLLVLGAGGKMGLHLCMMLRRAAPPRVRIVAVSRFQTLRDEQAFRAAGVETLQCDLSVDEQVAKLPDAEVVFFLAGVKFGTAAAPELLHQTNVLVPRRVAHRFRGTCMVALSTGCVYPFVPVTSAGASESTPPQPVGAYAESCLQRELEFARMSESTGTPVTLVRLNYSVEFRYGVLVDVAEKVLRRETIDVTMGHVNVIWQRDAVDTILRSAQIAGAPAVPLNVTGGEVLRVRDLARDFGQLFGIEPILQGHEAPTAWLSDSTRAHQLFGRPATSLASMQQWIASWLVAGEPTWGKPTGFEKRDGKF
jgi:nucleoside-diphosphate-sugar epimerase